MFEWKPAGTVTLRGRIEPVRAYAVAGLNGKNAEKH
jgi:class 3 adenylate cyclase